MRYSFTRHHPANCAGVFVSLWCQLLPRPAMEQTAVGVTVAFEDPGGGRATLRSRHDGLRILWKARPPASVGSLLLAIAQLRRIGISQRHLVFSLLLCHSRFPQLVLLQQVA